MYSNILHKNFLENFARIVKNAVPNFLWTAYRALNYRTEQRKNRCQPVSRLNRLRDLFKLGLGYRKLAMPFVSALSNFPPTFQVALSRGWTTMKRFDRSAHCSARTRGQPLEPFELVNCSSQRTGTVNSPSEIPLMDRIWIYRSTRARSAAVTGFLATGPDPKYPSPCCRGVIARIYWIYFILLFDGIVILNGGPFCENFFWGGLKNVEGRKHNELIEVIDDLNPHRLRLETDEDSRNRSRLPLDIILYRMLRFSFDFNWKKMDTQFVNGGGIMSLWKVTIKRESLSLSLRPFGTT